jgi:hypothetical protein
LIHIVRHLEKFRDEPLESVLRNVFDFDLHRHDLLRQLVSTFGKHGIKIGEINLLSLKNNDNDLQISYSTKPPADVIDCLIFSHLAQSTERLMRRMIPMLEEIHGRVAQEDQIQQEWEVEAVRTV